MRGFCVRFEQERGKGYEENRDVSASTVNPGSMMPHRITLVDVAAMAEADEHHKYELTPEGDLVVMTPPSLEHQKIVGRLFAWFLNHGYSSDQVIAEVGVYTGGG